MPKNKTHTLVVETSGKPVTYIVHASRKISGETAEGDAVQGTSLHGKLGNVPWNNTSDTKDVVKYRGHIETFQHNGNDIRLFLNGQRVSPAVLSDNHVAIRHPNPRRANKQPIQYQLTVNGRAITGESTEKHESVNVTHNAKTNRTIIRGKLTDEMDSFYFTGTVSATSINQSAKVQLNGQQVSNLTKVSNKEMKQPPSQTLTPTQTVGTAPPQSATAPRGGGPGMEPTESRTETNTQPESETGPSSPRSEVPTTGIATESDASSNLVFLLQILSGVLISGALLGAVFWYFRPRQRRW